MAGEILLLVQDRGQVGDRRHPGTADLHRLLGRRGGDADDGGGDRADEGKLQQAHGVLPNGVG